MAYNTIVGDNTLYPRTFYTMYIEPNNNCIGHLIFKLFTKQILTTMKYIPVPMHENLFETISKTDSFTNKIQINQPDSNRFTAQDDNFNNNKDDDETQSNDVYNPDNESYNEIDSLQQIYYMESNTMFHQGN